MANTITRVQDSIDYWGKSLVVPVDYTFDGTVAYVNGTGFTLNAKDIGMRFFRLIETAGGSLAAGTYAVKVSHPLLLMRQPLLGLFPRLLIFVSFLRWVLN